MAQAMVSPGDVILVPNPTYPIHAFGFIISGATIQHLPLSRQARISLRCWTRMSVDVCQNPKPWF